MFNTQDQPVQESLPHAVHFVKVLLLHRYLCLQTFASGLQAVDVASNSSSVTRGGAFERRQLRLLQDWIEARGIPATVCEKYGMVSGGEIINNTFALFLCPLPHDKAKRIQSSLSVMW